MQKEKEKKIEKGMTSDFIWYRYEYKMHQTLTQIFYIISIIPYTSNHQFQKSTFQFFQFLANNPRINVSFRIVILKTKL